jgi:hypothetical protein
MIRRNSVELWQAFERWDVHRVVFGKLEESSELLGSSR